MLEAVYGLLLIPVLSLVGSVTVIRCVECTMTVAMMLLPQCFHMVT